MSEAQEQPMDIERRLKTRQTVALTAINRQRNKLIQLMSNDDNLHLVKTDSDAYDELFVKYQTAHQEYYDFMIKTDEDEADRDNTRYLHHERTILEFQQHVKGWIVNTETRLSSQFDKRSITSTTSRTSRTSIQSARAKERARLAELMVEKQRQKEQLELQRKRHEVTAAEKELALDIEIDKTKAREQVFAEEEQLIELQDRGPDRNLEQPADVNLYPESIVKTEDKIAKVEEDEYQRRSCDQDTQGIVHVFKSDTPDTPAHTRPRGIRLNPSAMPYQQKASYPSTQFDRQCDTSYQATDLLAAITLPQPQVPKFTGDVLEYHAFVRAFDTRIASRTSTDTDRLYYLDQQLEGDPKSLIAGCLYMDATDGYIEARDLLKREYGDPYKICTAYVGKVLHWPILRHDDAQGLRSFSIFLTRCSSAMNAISEISVRNHLTNMQSIVKKLPPYLQNKWRDRACKLRENGETAKFNNLVDFIVSASHSVNDPAFGKDALSDHHHNLTDYPAGSTKGSSLKASSRSADTRSTRNNPSATGTKSKTMSFATDVEQSPQAHESKIKCYFCQGPHDIDVCPGFLSKSMDEKRAFIQEKRMCYGCYGYNHSSKGCMRRRRCTKCKKRHPTALHIDNFTLPQRNTQTTSKGEDEHGQTNAEDAQHVSNLSTGTSMNSDVLHAIIPVKVFQKNNGSTATVYAFYDNGSSGCFLTSDLKDKLRGHGVDTTLQLQTMHGTSYIKTEAVNDLVVTDMYGNNAIDLPRAYTRDEIPISHSQIPQREILSAWSQLKEACDGMHPYMPHVPIGLLIGNNCPKALQPLRVIPGQGNGPFAVLYPHGWTVNGPTQCDPTNHNVTCHRVNPWETTLVKETFTPRAILDMFQQDFNDSYQSTVPGECGPSQDDLEFLEEVTRDMQHQEGHYEVSLPFKAKHPSIPDNRSQALQRALWQKTKMLNDRRYHNDYVTFIDKLLQKGFAEEIPPDQLATQNGRGWYLPHHAVYHPAKPSKVRVVFDCSARRDGVSLGDCLLQGPSLTNLLVGVLTRFREEPYAFLADIEAMFHQVRTIPDCYNYLRFLWWPNGDLTKELQEYWMRVHIFGARSSPSIANFALRRTADDTEPTCGPIIADTIRKNFYVDCLKSVSSKDLAIEVIQKLRQACQEGGFRLTKFCCNDDTVHQSIPESERVTRPNTDVSSSDPVERVLGVKWSIEQDYFIFAVNMEKLQSGPNTRRGVLSVICSIYDPLGIISPLVLNGKRILQELCKLKELSWDDEIPESYLTRWREWLNELPQIEDVRLNRCLKPNGFGNVCSRQLHIFSDASATGYGSVAYLRVCSNNGEIHCSFLMSKSRLAPLHFTTIPRLELTAATVSVRLGQLLQRELEIPPDETIYHTDSTTVLHHIGNDSKRFPIFTANRIQLIRDYTSPSQWRYVDTKHNVADVASRGMTCQKLLKTKPWLQGPDFLQRQEQDWPEQPVLTFKPSDDDNDHILSGKVCVTAISTSEHATETLINHYSSWYRLKRAVAIYQKFFTVLKARQSKQLATCDPQMTVQELEGAEKAILRYTQRQHFQREMYLLSDQCDDDSNRRVSHVPKSSTLYRLDPFKSKGLLRIGGRLGKMNLPDATKYPIVLPQKCHVTTLILRSIHENLGHVGRNHVLSETATG